MPYDVSSKIISFSVEKAPRWQLAYEPWRSLEICSMWEDRGVRLEIGMLPQVVKAGKLFKAPKLRCIDNTLPRWIKSELYYDGFYGMMKIRLFPV